MAIEYKSIIIRDELQNTLTDLGKDNWQLIGFQNALYIFSKKAAPIKKTAVKKKKIHKREKWLEKY